MPGTVEVCNCLVLRSIPPTLQLEFEDERLTPPTPFAREVSRTFRACGHACDAAGFPGLRLLPLLAGDTVTVPVEP